VTDVATLIRDPRWLLWHFEPDQPMAVFARLDREELANATFADMRLYVPGRQVVRLPWPEVETALTDVADAPRAPARDFIMHSAFCGSTLASRCLDALGGRLAIREPMTLVSLANFLRFRHPLAMDARRWEPMFNGVLRLLGRPWAAGESVLVKPGNVANPLIPEILGRAPDSRILLMYSSLSSFLVSVLGRGAEGGAFARNCAAQLTWETEVGERYTDRIDALDDARVAGLAWRLQLDRFRDHLAGPNRARLASLSSEAFFADPAAAIGAMDRFFGGNANADAARRVAEGPLFTSNVKLAGRRFDPRAHASARREKQRQLQDRIRDVEDWLAAEFPGEAIQLPLEQPLI